MRKLIIIVTILIVIPFLSESAIGQNLEKQRRIFEEKLKALEETERKIFQLLLYRVWEITLPKVSFSKKA